MDDGQAATAQGIRDGVLVCESELEYVLELLLEGDSKSVYQSVPVPMLGRARCDCELLDLALGNRVVHDLEQ